jgi:hypothetical protein
MFLGLILAGLALGLAHPALAGTLEVIVRPVTGPPQGLEDPIWRRVEAVEIPTRGRDSFAGQTVLVRVRAVYTEEEIFFLFDWPDPTKSVIKNSWRFDGTGWKHLKGNEDRIALLFEISRINKFAQRGCAVTCHGPAGSLSQGRIFATETAAERGDLWHWTAARSAPVGHADDAWLGEVDLLGEYTPPKRTGRRKDNGRGGDVRNETPDGARPRYRQDPSKQASSPGFLLFEEAVAITDYSAFKAGDVIPYRLPIQPTGSRADIKALSRHDGRGWRVMLRRKLDTGHDDDVAFDPKKRYSFAIGLFDDSGDDHSKATEPLSLKFKR